MGFALFILLNAVLFIRPEEIWPEVNGMRLYLITITLCTVVNLPRLVRALDPHTLARSPIAVCVLGMLIAVPLSHLVRGDINGASDSGGEFAKVVLYYFLFVAVVDTGPRFRAFLGACVILICVLTAFALLQWFEYIDIESIQPVAQRDYDRETGEVTVSYRICSAGIFNDPNDLCLVLVFGILCCLYRALTASAVPLRVLWLAPVAAFGYTLVLTQSRGGMLGLLAGVAGFLVARFGWRRAAPLLVVCLPGLLLAVGGRQANIGLGKGDTANERVMLWAAGLTELFNRPVYLMTGLGAGEYAAEFGQVAHNSYIHAYVDLGLFGGTAFLGAFYWAARLLRRARPADPGLLRARPFVVAMFAAYAAGIYSLSRDYVIPTYLLLALVTCYVRLAEPAPPGEFRVSLGWARRTAVVGLAGLVGLKLFTQFAGHMGL
jgi:hypothetical protein